MINLFSIEFRWLATFFVRLLMIWDDSLGD